jgi:hypothetical protein
MSTHTQELVIRRLLRKWERKHKGYWEPCTLYEHNIKELAAFLYGELKGQYIWR